MKTRVKANLTRLGGDMKRDKISGSDDLQTIIVKMSEGNPGAMSVLMQMNQKKGPMAFMEMLSLDDMNIRGPQIWLGYKDHCGEDIDKFFECIKSRDREMISTINKYPEGNEMAVSSGASFQR